MNNEEQILADIFGESKKLWKDKYKISWCDLCETAIISCPKCENCSCNCSSCEFCHEDFIEFMKVKSRTDDYFNEDESNVLKKDRKLKEHILTCLGEGYSEINWEFLHKQGQLCLMDYFWFKELKDLKEEGIRDYMKHGSIDVIKDLEEKFKE